MKSRTIILAAAGIQSALARNACDQVQLEEGFVCKCSASYCDDMTAPPAVFGSDEVLIYTSNEDGVRLEQSSLPVEDASETNGLTVELDGNSFQEMLGFGTAFTDAAAYVISFLPEAAQEKLISSYFSRNGGSSYSVCRVPIGSTDFSRQSYSLIDANGDFAIMDDNLVPGEDAKLDLIKRAMAEIDSTSDASTSESKMKLQMFSSIWSAPVEMKTCEVPPAPTGVNTCGNSFSAWIRGRPSEPTFLFGGLDDSPEVRQAYADYILDFVQAYADEGVTLWGLTAQNEPAGNPVGNGWENTNYSPEDLVHFAETYLAPTLKSAFPGIKVMISDDNYPELDEYAELFAQSQLIDGVGFHWYFSMGGTLIGTENIGFDFFGGQIKVRESFDAYSMNNREGNGFLLMTEACEGYFDNDVKAGSWERGYNYMSSIIHEVESGAAGWVDWNLALDMEGGPNHADNKVDSPILVDTENGVFYKQPMFYTLAHFSAFVPPGAIRLGIADAPLGFIGNDKELEVVAFRENANSENCILVIANDHFSFSLPARGGSSDHTVVLKLGDSKQVTIEVPDNSYKTVLFHCPLTA